jgi:hypothetical protein
MKDKSKSVDDLVVGTQYSFKLTPVNVLGDRSFSSISVTAVAHAGASPLQSTASGGALYQGTSGTIQKVQVVSFSSSDCNTDGLHLSFHNSSYTENACDAFSLDFEKKHLRKSQKSEMYMLLVRGLQH